MKYLVTTTDEVTTEYTVEADSEDAARDFMNRATIVHERETDRFVGEAETVREAE